MNKETILKVESLTKKFVSSFGDTHYAVRDINFDIYKGEILCVLGQSGAGKSTLLHLLGGLLRPSDGLVYLGDELLPYDDENKMAVIRNKRFGFIFQFHHLLPEFTVLENLVMPGLMLESSQGRKSELEDKCFRFLDKVGMYSKVHNFPRELSGGEQQRVSVLRALVNEPDIVFADEPTGNLDQKNRKKTYDILEENICSIGATLVLVSHEKELDFKDFRKITLADGKILK